MVVVATAAVYYNSLGNEFLFDDLQTIVELKTTEGYGAFAGLLQLLKGRPAYRPIRTASYAFDYALSGLDPWGYHVANIAYHALSAIFVFLIGGMVFERVRPALIASLLFAVHPIQTDAVTYLSGRRDVLSGLFVLMGFTMFLRYRRTGRARDLAMVLLLCPLAFFSKESGIVLPLLCLGYDIVARIRVSARAVGGRLVRDLWAAFVGAVRQTPLLYLPFAVMGAGMAYYVVFVVRGTWQRTYHGGSLWYTLLTEARVVTHYLKLLIFPVTLNADYSFNAFPVTTSWTDPHALASIAILLVLGYGLLRCLEHRPLATFGGAWFALALLPVSQIVPHHEMMAEHYLYVPSVGFFLLVVALADPLLERPRLKPVLYAAGVAALLLLSLRTVWRNADWKDEVTFWSKTVQVAPQAARARNNLAAAYIRRGRPALAEEQLEAALRIRPDFAMAHANLGKIYMDRYELARAEDELTTALRLKQDETIPRLWLGAVYAREGKMAEAEQQFRLALPRRVYAAYAYNNLGAVFAKSGRTAEAETAFREALRRMPDLGEARENLARLSRLHGLPDQAGEPVKRVVP